MKQKKQKPAILLLFAYLDVLDLVLLQAQGVFRIRRHMFGYLDLPTTLRDVGTWK